jgi:hypothetical protein
LDAGPALLRGHSSAGGARFIQGCPLPTRSRARALAWLARQEAFAGALELNGNLAWWRRAIDLHPQGPFEDRARLQQSSDVIDEFGTEALYYERWERCNLAPDPCWGLRLRRLADGCDGFLVRVADKLMFSRGRTAPLPPGRTRRGASWRRTRHWR